MISSMEKKIEQRMMETAMKEFSIPDTKEERKEYVFNTAPTRED